jgi:hypothetical protein
LVNLKEKDHLRYLGIDWGVIYMWMLRTVGRDDVCIHPAQNGVQRRAIVNTVMNLRVPK